MTNTNRKVFLSDYRLRWNNNNWEEFCDWGAGFYEIEGKKVNIMYDIIDYINNKVLSKHWLIGIYSDKNDEDLYYFDVYEYQAGYTEEDYINKGNLRKYWFGFVENKIVTV